MKKLLFVLLSAASSAFATEALIDVSNVRMSQNVSTRRVTVKYDLTITNSEDSSLAGAIVRLDVLTNTPSGYVSIGREYVKTVTGDYSPCANNAGTKGLVTAGTDKVMVWNAKRDFPGRRLADVKVAVKAYYPGEMVFDEWKYLVMHIGTNNDQPKTYSWELTDLNPDEYDPNPADVWKKTASEIWFVRCPAGSFTMGSPEGAVGYQSTRPLHKVTLTQPFYMEITPMTKHQWSRVKDYRLADSAVAQSGVTIDAAMGANWYQTREIDPSSVVGKLRARSGLNVTIPTEAQWEYACRAGSRGSYSGTDEFFTTKEKCNAYYQQTWGLAEAGKGNSSSVWNACTNVWGVAGMHTSIATFVQDTQDAVSADDAVDPLTKGTSAGFVLKGPWTWAGTATCHEHIGNAAINHSFTDAYCGARLVVMP